MKTIFDPSFKYRSSVETDVRKTFERVRREQLAQRRSEGTSGGSGVKVVQLDPMRGGPQPAQRAEGG